MANPLTKEEVEQYLGKVDLRGPLEEALNVAVSNLTMDPTGFLSGHFAGKKKATDLGITPAMVGPCDGLLPQPTQGARFTTVLVEYNIPGHEGGVGGADKGKNGHRVDSIPIANGVIKTNNYCFPIKFVPADYELFSHVVKGVDGIIVRINPGQMDGPTQTKFDALMRECIKIGIPVWSSPDVQIQMGAKDALCKIANLNCGLPDTLAYYTEDEFKAGFYKTMAYQPRVIKQNRGSSGEGIWIIKLKDREYCPTFGAALCEDDWVLDMMEANDNHQEFHTCGEFVEFCLNGRTDKSGTWTTKGVGKYLEGGKDAGGQLVDQRFCPRIVEGEVRVLTSGPTCLQLIHKKPAEGGISAVLGTGSVYTFYSPDEPKFAELKRKLFDEDLPKIMPALDLAGEPFPIIWTTDLIPYTDDNGKDQYTVGEFNCSCVGISKFQACAYPDKGLADVIGDDLAEATMVADYAGTAAVDALTMRNAAALGYFTPFETGPMVGLNPQPSNPTYKLLCVEYNIPGHPSGVGGADKGKHGHRVDSIPICNGVIKAGGSCYIIKYKPEAKEAFKKIVMGVDGLIVRINPGQMDGPNQDIFDSLMRECIAAGIPVWSSPDVQIQMGAKDALCKIANLNCGLPDTLAYYTEDEFKAGFYKTMAYQPRVIKQNRGSSGEGIWIIKLKDREYCPTFGAALCEDDWVLDMMEANDNHQEFHTCGEFVEFCLNGRTDKSGTWTTKGVGKYLEGGKDAGGQLVDQRFCPRIVEGEVRVLTSGPTCLQLIHKKPAEGGISAVLGTGSVYTFYSPDEPKFAELKRKLFDEDLPKIMPALDLAGEPFPIIWTTDLIPYTDDNGKDQYTVGEFNCSCVGISKFQACAYPDKGIFDCKGADFAEAMDAASMAG